MKRIISVLLFLSGTLLTNAGPVSSTIAKSVAANFYTQNTGIQVNGAELTYTKYDSYGQPLCYIFNINNNGGFVIVSAEDATSPILGYSTKGHYIIPKQGTNIDFWIQHKTAEISAIRTAALSATTDMTDEWTSYQNNTIPSNRKESVRKKVVLPLCQSTWDQAPGYNGLCPGGSVTGCVATAMAQIMRYWQFPAFGIGSSCYSDEVSNGYQENYGNLCAYYDTSHYAWSAMPLASSSDEVAKLMYDCGVSVQMDYSPSESGSFVVGNPPSAQYSYPTYFGYNSNTLQGLRELQYNTTTWENMIETELNAGRLVQYAGTDKTAGGHTWVLDGYDANSEFHMNWGWSAQDDGYYTLAALNPGSYDFIEDEEMLIGIEPLPVIASFSALPVSGCAGMMVTFKDQSFISPLAGSITGWSWSFPGGTPSSSALQNPTVTYNTPGTYNVTLTVTNNLGNNSLTQSSLITVNPSNALPLVQNFEGTFPPSQWIINNPDNHPTTWKQYTGTGGYGKSNNCMYFNNCSGGGAGDHDQIYTPAYDFSSVTYIPYIFFDVAYAPYNSDYSDSLAVYYSLDCGQNFTLAYHKGGLTLATTGGLTVEDGANKNKSGCFVPLATNWRTDTIKIPAIEGQSSVIFSFENRSGDGSNMYIDNINVPIPTGIDNLSQVNVDFSVYPNPSNGLFNIKFNAQSGENYQMAIYNVLGQMVASTTIQDGNGEYLYPVNLSGLSKGIYSVVLKTGTQQSVRKIALF